MLQIVKSETNKNIPITSEHSLNNCLHCISRSVCLLQSLDEDQIKKISGLPLIKTKFRKGDILLRIGDTYRGLFNLRAGFIKREYVRFDGERQVAKFIEPGSLFGFDGIEHKKYHLEAIALTDGELCNLTNSYLSTILQKVPETTEIINYYFSKNLNDLEDHLFSLGNHSAENKLLNFLYWFHQVSLKNHPNKNFFELPMSRDDLRSYIGMTIETLSRCFSRIEERGIIEVHNRVIKIIKLEDVSIRIRG